MKQQFSSLEDFSLKTIAKLIFFLPK